MRGFGAGWASERDRPLVLHHLTNDRIDCGTRLSARVMAVSDWPSVTCLRCLRGQPDRVRPERQHRWDVHEGKP